MEIIARAKSVGIVAVTIVASAIGLEVGNIGGQALANDVRFIIGKAPHPVYKEGKVFKHYVSVNPYTGEQTRVKYNKKTGTWIPKGKTAAKATKKETRKVGK